ncbi:ABC transporter substrate-binding protein [Aequorivita soesokkakensis]|jgi:ABC-type nitrate/sulfonate/bicarbonate transport system substrate-binding protein|uniref:ABC transporter substrate-binding protein n=1 Tax=Aequorivita soesokkakensis TaxID=1385699 RepID=A0A1A9LI85_9FLAO|nr:substrate-binding domain-containing protein [Aequorivita soesokkakensis]OAD92422.1 ABC transporter substrate-binding protein [Aequorivita soesokkakensis]
MKNFIIGGVPEHFNLPWYIALRDKKFNEKGINLRWKDFAGGTGQMCRALREKEIDMAVILTEGMVRDIINGSETKIVQVFVKSPLLWGIHVAANSDYETVSDLKGTEAAISRYGSGSHLMAFVNAENLAWDLKKDLNFKVIKDLDGALEGLPKGDGDYFMWEKFMTKPHVDKGIFRLVGESPTPWPSFVIAVRNDVLENEAESVKAILEVINLVTSDFKTLPNIDEMIAKRYGQKIEDVREWLSLTEWSDRQLTSKELENIQQKLLELDLIEAKIQKNNILENI